jgi:hypothetical protein
MLPSRVAPACYAQLPDAAILWRNLDRHNPLPPGVRIIFSGATLTASNYDSPFNHSQYEYMGSCWQSYWSSPYFE